MRWVATKGTVRCEHCGYICDNGYQYKDKLYYRCNKGFFRFGAYETWSFEIKGNEKKRIGEMI